MNITIEIELRPCIVNNRKALSKPKILYRVPIMITYYQNFFSVKYFKYIHNL